MSQDETESVPRPAKDGDWLAAHRPTPMRSTRLRRSPRRTGGGRGDRGRGSPQTFKTRLDIVRPGGTVANVGVHGTGVELPLDQLWISNVRIAMGLVDCRTVDRLLAMVQLGKLPAA